MPGKGVYRILPPPAKSPSHIPPPQSSWSYIQGKIATKFNSSTIALSISPSAGNLLCVAVTARSGVSLVSVQDNLGNSLVISPSSPASAYDSSAGSAWGAYLLKAASGVTTITATFSGTITIGTIRASEFSCIGGNQAFDTDGAANGTGGSVNLPTLTLKTPGELVYGIVNSIFRSLTFTGAYWKQDLAGVSSIDGTNAEYLPGSPSTSATVSFTQDIYEIDADVFNGSSLGSQWEQLGGADTLTVSANKVTCGSSFGLAHNLRQETTDQFAQVTIKAFNSAGNLGVGVRVENDGSGNINGYTFQYGSNYEIDKWVSNVSSVLANGTGASPQVGDQIRLEIIGTTLKAYVNGSLLLTATDSTYPDGFPAISVFKGSSGNSIGEFLCGLAQGVSGADTFPTSSLSVNWFQEGGYSGLSDTLAIFSGKVSTVGTAWGNIAFGWAPSGTLSNNIARDQFAQATLTKNTAGSTAYLWVRMNGTHDSFGGYCLAIPGIGSTNLYIQRGVAGTSPTTIAGPIAATVTAGDVFKMQVIGSTIKLYQNGTLITTVTDTTYPIGNPGIGIYNGNAGALASWNNFSCGSIEQWDTISMAFSPSSTGNTYNASASFSATGGFTEADTMTFSTADAFSLTGSLSEANTASLRASESYAVAAAAVPSENLSMNASESLGLTASSAVAMSLTVTGSMSLTLSQLLSMGYSLTLAMLDSFSLTAGFAQSNTATLVDSETFGLAAAIAILNSKVYVDATTFSATLGFTDSENLTFAESASLSLIAGLAETNTATLVESEHLSVAGGFQASNNLTAVETETFGLTAALGLLVGEAYSLTQTFLATAGFIAANSATYSVQLSQSVSAQLANATGLILLVNEGLQVVAAIGMQAGDVISESLNFNLLTSIAVDKSLQLAESIQFSLVEALFLVEGDFQYPTRMGKALIKLTTAESKVDAELHGQNRVSLRVPHVTIVLEDAD